WSSDVCSSDLAEGAGRAVVPVPEGADPVRVARRHEVRAHHVLARVDAVVRAAASAARAFSPDRGDRLSCSVAGNRRAGGAPDELSFLSHHSSSPCASKRLRSSAACAYQSSSHSSRVLSGSPLLCEALPQLTPAWTAAPVSRRLPPLPGCDLQARRTDGRVVTAKHLGELKERELRLAASVHRLLPRCDEAPSLARPEKLVARHDMGLRNLVDDGVQAGAPVLLGCHVVSSCVLRGTVAGGAGSGAQPIGGLLA